MLVVRLSRDVEERLERFAKQTGRTKTDLAREAIIKRLGDLERTYLSLHHVRSRKRRGHRPRATGGTRPD